ncbi:MAG: hypothetical protein HY288_19750 [Planctomycetia bacterium]|nr:hypothetical protein [Planctomycetia bacterium]
MHRGLFYLTAPVLLWNSLSLVSQAQLVQVGPGFVKAPFVRVYRYPDGGSYVRAPFVSVSTPGYRMGRWAYRLPASTDFLQMDWRMLSQTVLEWSARLDADLDYFPSGKTWRSQLKTAEIAALVPKDRDAPPAADVRQQLQEILEIHRAASNSPELSRIANLPSFQILQLALAEYVTPSEQRSRRQLFFAAGELNRSLERFTTGGGWQQYLALSPGLVLSDDKALETEPVVSSDEFAQVLARFNSVSQNTDYRVISALPAFEATHERLAAYLGRSPTPSLNPPEELPAPRPDSEP